MLNLKLQKKPEEYIILTDQKGQKEYEILSHRQKGQFYMP